MLVSVILRGYGTVNTGLEKIKHLVKNINPDRWM